MTWSSFTCENPDFTVRSIPDDIAFRVRRAALNNSEVFRDMFICCDQSSNEMLNLHEPAQVLSALLRLLHDHSAPIVEPSSNSLGAGLEDENIHDTSFNREIFMTRIPSYDYTTVIPLPVLQPTLFDLVDKYGLSIDIFRALCSHLLAHAPTHPLRVYGFAASFECHHYRCRGVRPSPSVIIEEDSGPAENKFGVGAEKEMEKEMRKVASKASQFLKPMGSYPMDEVLDAIPDVRALHRVVRLQYLRVNVLRDALSESEIFPKGYGTCPLHREETLNCWDRQRKALAGKIDSGTDVAGEMDLFVDTLKECKTCHKAGVAAVEMLAYVCYRLLKQAQHAAWLAP